MTDLTGEAFWQDMADLAASRHIVLDRPRGAAHPRYPELVYPLDYGYIEGKSAADGDGIDIWIGSQGKDTLTGILCTYDTFKRDAEIKLLLGCTTVDAETILNFNNNFMRYLYIPQGQRKTNDIPRKIS